MTAPIQPGDILCDRYRVDRVLGAGGMGVVVLAEHIELRERVAIKFLLDSSAEDTELSERFLREARAAVKIRSEHVVRVSDVGRLPSGAPYLVMEYLEGEDLGQRLERGAVPIEDAVDYVIQCCEAMHVAHRSGIVHRDLKPANLFLTQRPDGSPIIKVLDFGISKVAGPEAQQLSLTRTQAMMGSPLYMSPEQMRSSKDVGPSTDIWALGVILHELICGDVPFTGAAVTEVLVKVMQDAPPRLRALRPEVPEALEAVVLRCMAKSPAERFPSVAALAVALAPFASGHTLGLQRRLQASLNDPALPAAPADERRFAATRVEGATAPAAAPETPAALPQAAPAAAPAATRLEVIAATPAGAVPAQTNTGWEGESPASPRASPPWRRPLPLLAGAAGLALFGGLMWARLRDVSVPHQEGPLPAPAAAAAPSPPAPAATAVPAAAAPPSAAPMVAPTSNPPEELPAPSATSRPAAKRSPAPAARNAAPAAPAAPVVSPSAARTPAVIPHHPIAVHREPAPPKDSAATASPAPTTTAPARPKSLSIDFK